MQLDSFWSFDLRRFSNQKLHVKTHANLSDESSGMWKNPHVVGVGLVTEPYGGFWLSSPSITSPCTPIVVGAQQCWSPLLCMRMRCMLRQLTSGDFKLDLIYSLTSLPLCWQNENCCWDEWCTVSVPFL